MHPLEWALVLLGACCLAFVAGLFWPTLDSRWLDPRRQASRKTELAIRAATAGLRQPVTTTHAPRLEPAGKSPTVAFTGTYQGRQVMVAEYLHVLPGGGRGAGRGRHVRHSSVIAVPLRHRYPSVTVVRRDIDTELWETMVRSHAPVDASSIEVNRAAFDETFRVLTRHPERARRLLHPRLVDVMLRHESVRAWVVTDDATLLGVGHEMLPHRLLPRIGTVRLAADLIEHSEPARPETVDPQRR